MGRAYEGDPTRLPAESFGLTPVVPPKRNRTAPWDYDREAYKGRNMVERVFNRMKCVCSLESGPCERVDVFHVSGRFWSTSACGEKRTPARPAWTSFPS